MLISCTDCKGDLICEQRDAYEEVPGCVGEGLEGYDYCREADVPSDPVVAIDGSIDLLETYKVREPMLHRDNCLCLSVDQISEGYESYIFS